MELANKKSFVFVFFLTMFVFIGCKSDKEQCYYIMELNFPTDLPSRSPIFYAVEDYQIAEQIKGKHIVDDYYQSEINNIKVVKDRDTLDSNDGGFIKIKMISGVTCIRFITARFQILHKDSISAMEQIKSEDILLELKNGKKIHLKYCKD